MLDVVVGLGAADQDRVDAERHVVAPVLPDRPEAERAAKPPQLGWAQALGGRAVARRGALTHLDRDDHRTVSHDQVQLAAADDGVRVTEVRPGVVATFFADGTPRPADASALSAEDVADAIVYALTRPERMRLDEIHFHPQGQTPEF
jgi:hypothetical protein